MKSKHPLSWLFILISACWLLIYNQSAQATPGLTIGNYQLVSSKRITRTVFEYTYKASITNTGNDAVGVSSALSVNTPGITVLDNKLDFGDVPNGKTIASTDTFVIQQDRKYSFAVDSLQWLIEAAPAALLINNVTPSSGLPGTKVAITLQGIINDGADLTLSLGGQSLSYAFRDDSESVIEFTVPSNIPSASLFVSQQEQQSNGVWFDVTSNAVRIPAANEIALDELGNKVAINLVLVSFHENDYTLSEAQRVAHSVGAEITAALPLVDGYQFKLQTTNLEELQQAISILESDPAVDFVVRETHIPSNEVPTNWTVEYTDDPRHDQRLINRVEEGAEKYIANVDPSAEGKLRPSEMKIGVLELGIDFFEKDFQLPSMTDPSAIQSYFDTNIFLNGLSTFGLDIKGTNINHGTDVVGVMAAKLNNDEIDFNIGKCVKGCNAGLLQGLGKSHGGFRINVFAAVIPTLSFNSASTIVGTTNISLLWGANVINWSFGIQDKNGYDCKAKQVTNNTRDKEDFDAQRELYEKLLVKINKDYPQVIIVNAAGNNSTFTSDDATVPPGIKNDSMLVIGAHGPKPGIYNDECESIDLPTEFPVNQKNLLPMRSYYSNFGPRVDISAVGEIINSSGTTVRGTSYAAPLVTATVAAMKSIKPNLTATEARHILRKYALPMYPKVNNLPGILLVDTTALLQGVKGEVRPDGRCFSDPSLWCEGMGARLNVEGAIQGVLDSLTTDTPLSSLPFTDAKLLTCVFKEANEHDWQYVQQVTSLSCAGKEITNLSGLENLKQLTSLDLSGNTITDLPPLIGLTQLQQLNLSGNTSLRCVELDELAAALSSTAITRPTDCIQLPPTPSSKLNDTGITTCSNATTNGLACPVAGFPGQDGEHGRDVTHNDDSDGHAGFSFTKLDSNGNPLPASASGWNCVKDNVTGLIWEVKTDDGGLRDKDNTYSWYEPDNSKNGGGAGMQNGGSCTGSNCDTQGYAQAVNTQGLCGASDWRMPDVNELLSIVNNATKIKIDTNYFPNTSTGNMVWSSSPLAYYSNYSAWWVSFSGGSVSYIDKGSNRLVRLVRGGQ